MMPQKKILHIIESLGIGGAELLLVNTIKELPEYQHVVVCLNENDFLATEINQVATIYKLPLKKNISVFSLRKNFQTIVKNYKPEIIHSHLQLATLFVRFAGIKKVYHIFTIHSLFSKDAFQNKWRYWIEKYSYSNNETIIAVSETALSDYKKFIPVKGRVYVVHNFVPDHFFSIPIQPNNDRKLRMVAFGNLKEAKNYSTLIDLLTRLDNIEFELDIYGEGPLKQAIRNQIAKARVPVFLKGKCNHPEKILPNYDVFVMASAHEGFGIALAEAMAVGLPVLVSDIPAFREVADQAALYFSLDNPQDFANQISFLLQQKENGKLKALGHAARERALKIASKENYLKKIRGIYREVIVQNK